jgi:signal transduction histidine kinase/CheY-like chemotaxis protein
VLARHDLWIPAAYAVVSASWIALSDVLLSSTSQSIAEQTAWSIVKGVAFVVVTALALHAGIRWALAREHRAIEALRLENQRKGEFIALLSHELRNPLAPLRHALWILGRAPAGSPQAVHAQETIARQVLHLTRLTDDLLDVTRMSSGTIVLHKTRLDLGELVRRVLQDHAGLFAARNVSLSSTVERLPLWIDADATRMAQVIGCVLWNAAKFTDPGGRATIAVERGAAGWAVVRVADDGIGIPASVLAHVFEPFVQGDTTLDRRRGGLGLGLSVTRALVDLHGGTVEARSDGPGRGAEFTVRVPLAPERPTLLSAARPTRATMPHHRVLVVEDNLDAAETLQEMLLLWDHEVEVAHDGRAAIEKARAFRPDVVLCDIGLPRMDGYEVARALRADPELASVFLVAVTGYASPEDARKAAGAGFDRHLGKPVPIEVVEEVLATAPSRAASAVH